MRLICPNCTAQYEVPADVIPPSGRDVQCSNCSHTWFQDPIGPAPDLDPVPVIADTVSVAPPEPNAAAADEQEHSALDDFERELDKALEDDFSLDQDDTPPLAVTPTRPKRQLDSAVASVLREEAEREKRARAADPVETQGDLGLDYNQPADDAARRRKSGYMGSDLNDLDDLYNEGAKDPEFHRRDLLPDIEEINSTLRNGGGDAQNRNGTPDTTASNRNARSGFLLALILLAAAVWVYLYATLISAQLPALAPYMDSYVAWVDVTRGILDAWTKEAMIWLEDQANKARAG